MPRNPLPITTVEELLDALHREFGSGKVSAQADNYPSFCRVVETFDTGRGHSTMFESETSELDPKVLEEARKRNYVLGRPLGRSESKNEFVLTDNEYTLRELRPLIEKGKRIRWGKKSAEYLLRCVPAEYRGFDFDHAISRLVSGDNAASIEVRMAKALAEWDTGNDRPRRLDALLFSPEPGSEQLDPGHEFIPSNERERLVAKRAIATFFQYLGTKGGVDFLVRSLRISGWDIKGPQHPTGGN